MSCGLRNKGFTLPEIMISLTMLGLIAVIIFGAMRLGFRSVEKGERVMESLERFRVSLSIIESQIQSFIPLSYDEQGSRRFYFTGKRDALQFTSNHSLWGSRMGYVLVSYRVVQNEQRRFTLLASETGMAGIWKTDTKLIDGFDSIYFDYLYKDPTAGQGGWVDMWTDETTTPDKIRLHIVEGTRHISLMIPLKTKGMISQTPRGELQRFMPIPEG